MFTIGVHLSIAKGFAALGRHALDLGANTAAFFTRNPRGGAARAMDPRDVAAFLALARENGFGRLVAHASYTLNAAAKTQHLRDYARQTMADDLQRMAHLPGNLYNFHPGSHVGQGLAVGIEHVAALLNSVLTPEIQTTVLLETMSGSGSEIGGTFEDLRAIIDRVEIDEKVGVCLDTCHVWAAGYDIADDLDGVLTQFDKVVGLGRLRAIHLNDSQYPRGLRKDRHAGIGQGQLGMEAMDRIINHPALRALPFILETPQEDTGWAREIRMLKTLRR